MNLLDLYDAQKPAPYILGGIKEEFIEESWFDNVFRSAAKQTAESSAEIFAKKLKTTLSEGIEQSIKGATERGAREVSQQGARQAAETFAKETIEKGAKDAGQSALKNATPELITETGIKVIRETAEKTFRTTLEETGQEISETAIKEAGEKAVKEASPATIKAAGENAIQESVEKLAREEGQKTARELLEKTFKTTPEETLQKGISATGKAANELVDNTRVIGKSTMKNAWESFKDMGKRLGRGAKAASGEMIDFARKHPYIVVGGITLVALLGIATDRFNKMNGKEFPIISVKKKGVNFLEIVFSSDTNLIEEDSIEILNCDAEPSIAGKTFVIDDVTNTTTIIVKSDLKLTKDGTTGTFKYTTDFGSVFKGVTREAIKGATGTLKEGIRELASTAGDVGGSAFKGFWEGLGLPSFGSISSIISIVGIFFLLSSLFLVYRNLTK